MVLTIFEWIVVGLIILGGLAIVSFIGYGADSIAATIISAIIVVIITLASIFGFNWHNTNTASGIRNMKDYTSYMNNGIEREITITAEDGREIFHYEGKVDIETRHEGNDNYILFESEENKRYIIYYGIQDTVLIIEK